MTTPFTAHAKAADLASGLRYVAVAVAKKPPVAVLAGVMLTATEDGITLSAYDYVTSATVRIAGSGEGSTIVGHAQLTAVLKAFGKNDEIEMSACANALGLTGHDMTVNVDVIDAAFPELPEPGVQIARLPSVATFEAVNSAAGRDDTLPALCGVRFIVGDAGTELAATDRYRLVESALAAVGSRNLEVTVPWRAVAHVGKNFKGGCDLHASNGDAVVTFTDGEKTLSSRVIDAAFPKYKSLIPTEHPAATAMVDSTSLIAALKRVAATIGKSDIGQGVGVELLPDGVWIGSLRIPAKTDGEFNFRIAPQYMIDALAAVGPGEVTVSCFAPKPEVPNGLRPVLFSNERGVRAIVMPIRLGAK